MTPTSDRLQPSSLKTLLAWAPTLSSLTANAHAKVTPLDAKERMLWLQLDATDKSWWINPYEDVYGPCPFDSQEIDPRIVMTNGEVHQYITRDPPGLHALDPLPCTKRLHEIDFATWLPTLEDITVIRETSRGCVCQATSTEGVVCLKLFSPGTRKEFISEHAAYTNILNAFETVPDTFPRCMGWTSIPPAYLASDKCPQWLQSLHLDKTSPNIGLLLLEFLDGSPLFTGNISDVVALKALEALGSAHQAGIVHNEAFPHHFLLSGERVVLFDFDMATVSPDPSASSVGQWREMKELWKILFNGLLPDKYMGVERDWKWTPASP
ncbi:hypothetical protein CALVIDRAFT_569481 [Calocera viscosa TUFC12733]|uniref:Protein kinase domain-containing protein n=1 Tax=Calocera viscosa (strain TUFC12733) TaxID=1330018 RepID=A0A167FY86_CALVF|nr:hypothetical protein CALVIDRAFT_569481 [Calocera viscosa TUFC12733]